MLPPPHRQRVGLLPLSIKGQAAGPSDLAAARGVGGLCMPPPSWCWESGQGAAPVTGKPHLGCEGAITISTLSSRYKKSWRRLLRQCTICTANLWLASYSSWLVIMLDKRCPKSQDPLFLRAIFSGKIYSIFKSWWALKNSENLLSNSHKSVQKWLRNLKLKMETQISNLMLL